MNPRVKEVKPLPNCRLELTFANGEVGVYDCRPLLDFGVFRELKDEAYFRKATAVNGTVVWPHEQDICPDTLYLESVRKPWGGQPGSSRAEEGTPNRAGSRMNSSVATPTKSLKLHGGS